VLVGRMQGRYLRAALFRLIGANLPGLSVVALREIGGGNHRL
jgi:hypothetical protein